MTGTSASSQATVRAANRRQVLQCIVDRDGRTSRASVARATGLTSATVSSIVAELIDNELVENSGRADSTGGKRATYLGLRTDRLGIGALVLRRHSLRVAAVNLAGDVVWERPVLRSQSVVSIDDIRAAVSDLVSQQPLALIGIGVDIPGALNGGVILESVQMQLNSTDLATQLADITAAPVYLVNDADAEGLSEYTFAGAEDGSLLSVSIGIGIGAAVIVDGRLHQGPRSLAGEIGHVRVDFSPTATQCSCGNRGCMEQVASLPVVLGLDKDTDYPLDGPEVDPARIEALMADPTVRYNLDRSHRTMAATIITICSTLDITNVAIGGDAPFLGPEYLSGLRRYCSLWQPVGSAPLNLRMTANNGARPFRGASEYALRRSLDVTWG